MFNDRAIAAARRAIRSWTPVEAYKSVAQRKYPDSVLGSEVANRVAAARKNKSEGSATYFVPGLLINVGASGSGKSRLVAQLMERQTGRLGYDQVSVSVEEPQTRGVCAFGRQEFCDALLYALFATSTVLLGKSASQASADPLLGELFDKPRKTPKPAPGEGEKDAKLEAREKEAMARYNERVRVAADAWERLAISPLAPTVLFADSLSCMAMAPLENSAATAGGYPRGLPGQFLAMHEIAIGLGIIIVGAFNPFAAESRDIALVTTMADGSCLGLLSFVNEAGVDFSTGRSTTVANMSMRPSLRGADQLNDIQLFF
jgi:hypothetical protein